MASKYKKNMDSGGEGGIRTPDTLSGMSAFEADRFNHSRTSPFTGALRDRVVASRFREAFLKRRG